MTREEYEKSAWPTAPFPPLTLEKAAAICDEANGVASGYRLDEVAALLRSLARTQVKP